MKALALGVWADVEHLVDLAEYDYSRETGRAGDGGGEHVHAHGTGGCVHRVCALVDEHGAKTEFSSNAGGAS